MADKTVIVEIQYDTAAAIKNLDSLTASVEGEKIAQAKLKAELEAGTISQKEYALQVEQSKQASNAANAERKQTLNLITAEKGSINELKANIKLLTTERDKLNQNTVAGKKSAQEYTDKIKEMKLSLAEAGQETKKTGGFFGNLGKDLSAIPGPIGGIIQGIGGMTKAALAFIATPLGMILAALAVAIKSVMTYFSETEEGENKLNKATTELKAVWHGLVEVFSKVGGAIVTAITEPKKAIAWFKQAGQDLSDWWSNTIGKSFIGGWHMFTTGMAVGVAEISLLWQKFKNNFSDNAKGVADAQKNLTDKLVENKKANDEYTQGVLNTQNSIKDGINGLINKTKEFMAEEAKRVALAAKLADAQAARDKEERADLITEAKLRLEAAKALNEASEKDKLSIAERIALMEKSLNATKQLAAMHLEDAKRDERIAEEKFALNKKDKDALDELAKARATVIDTEREYYDSTKKTVKALAAFRIQLEKEQQDAILQTFEASKTSIEKNLESLKEAKGQERNILNLTLTMQLDGYKADIAASNLTAENKKKLLAEVGKLENQQALDNKKNYQEEAKLAEDAAVKRGQAIMKLADIKEKELELEKQTIQEKNKLQIDAEDANYQRLLSENDRIRQAAAKETDAKTKADLEAKLMSSEALQVAEEDHKLKLLEIEAGYQEQVKQMRQQALDEQLDALNQIVGATEGMSDQRVTIGLAAFAKLQTINFSEIKSAKDAATAIGGIAMSLTALINSGHDKQLASLKAEKDAELVKVGDNKDAQDAINRTYAIKEQELKKKQFNEDKKKALIDAAIATALAIIKGLSSGLPMPGILMAALAAVAGGIAIASIAKQQYTPTATYAKGGIIGGQSHARGGTQFIGSDGSRFEAEAGEAMFVLKKDATAEIAALSMINESHGGRSFTQSSGHLAEGGEVGAMPDVNKMVDDAMQRTPIFVRVGDIETGMTETRNVKQAGVI
jgi:hypothetical protein